MYLNTHTYYSFKYGTINTKELLLQVQGAGVNRFALTDINSTSASLNFVRLAPQYDIQPVLGVDFRNGAEQLFIGIAKNNEGFKELNDYLSSCLHLGEGIPKRAPIFKQVYIIYPLQKYSGFLLGEDEYIGVKPQFCKKQKNRI